MRRRLLPRILLGLALLVAASGLRAEGGDPIPDPGPRELCTICGMFVAKYPDWIASLRFQDGAVFHFDGAKDLFKFLHQLPRYAPGRKPDQIRDMVVSEYYDVERIPAREALYVIGSDVYGPMGDEFIPLRNQADAEEFKMDHHGVRILRFDEIDAGVVEKVDKKQF